MDTLKGIRVFRQVVESGSFIAAAERVELSPAMVSKHVMQVERRLGVRLLNRNTRTLSLTEPGRLYFERCKTFLEDLQTAEAEVGSLASTPSRGTLRITAPSFTAGHLVPDLLAQYRGRCPEVLVDASFDDRFVDLVEEGYDLALRIARTPAGLPSGLIARPVRPATFHLAASREYLERHGTPRAPGDLVRHDFVTADNLSSLPVTGPMGTTEIPLRVVLRSRSTGGIANAIAAGIGIGPVPALVFEQPPFKDILTPILLEYPLAPATLYVVYANRRFITPKVRSFVDFAIESLALSPKPFCPHLPVGEGATSLPTAHASNSTLPHRLQGSLPADG